MADDADKSPTPETSTVEAPSEGINDKDLGQVGSDTGESQADSEAQDLAPSEGSESEEETQGENPEETTSEEKGADQDEKPLLTPEEVAKLPPELKAQYVSMNKRFQEGMRKVNEAIDQAGQNNQNRPAATEAGEPDTGKVIVESVLKRRGVDPTKLSKEWRDTLDILADVAQEAAGLKTKEAVAPIVQKDAKAEVDGFFSANPEASKHREAMGRLDERTGGTLTLQELYGAVAGKELVSAAAGRKDQKLRNLAKGNSESATGTPGGGKEGDIFDEIANAGGRENKLLR